MRLQRALVWLVRGLAIGLGLSLLAGGFGLLQAKLLKQEFLVLTLFLTLTIPLVVSVSAYLWKIEKIKAARYFDRELHLGERVSTALELQTENHSVEIIQKQLDDAIRASRAVNPRRNLPLRFSKIDAALALLFAALIGLIWFRGETLFAAASQQRAVEQAITEQQAQIEEIIKEIEANQELTDEQKQALTEPLQQALSDLEENPTMEGAVSTLVNTGEKLQALSSEQVEQSLQTLKETGSSLAAQEGSPLESVGKEMAQGNLANAASELANMDLSQMSSEELQQTAEQLQAMANSLAATNPQLAQELSNAAQAIQNGNLQEAQQALANASSQMAQAGQQVAASQMASQAASQLQQGAGQVIAAGGNQPTQGNASTPGQGNPQSGQTTSGAGSGSGSGDAPDSDQAGSEAGSSPIQQNNGAGDGGESAYEQIYAPSLLGGAGSDTLGLPSSGEDGDVVGTSPTNAEDGQSLVPYTEVYSQYNQFNRQAVENGEVPVQFMDIIRNYFDSLQP